MAQLFKDNAYSIVNGAINDAVTAIPLLAGTGVRFPVITGEDFFMATIAKTNDNGLEDDWEIVKVTGVAGDVLTVVRAQEGTTAKSWVSGVRVELRLTAATLTNMASSGGGTSIATLIKYGAV